MFQIHIEFPFLLNTSAVWPRWAHMPAGCRAPAPPQTGHVPSSLPPSCLDGLTRPHDPQTSELAAAPGSRHMAQTRLCGLLRGWTEKASLPVPCPGPHGVGTGVTAKTSGCCLLPTDGPLCARKSLRGRFRVSARFTEEKAARRGRGRLCPGPHGW